MAWLAVDRDGSENIYDIKPIRDLWVNKWDIRTEDSWWINLPQGTIEKIIGRSLTWEDNPVEIK